MNAHIVSKWNSVVTDSDTVYVIGDVFLGSHWAELKGYLNRMNGNKILVLGNHDLMNPFQYVECGFQSVHTYLEVELCNGETVNLIHDPSAACVDIKINPNRWLTGHVHNLYKSVDNDRVINMSVEVWNYTPVSENIIINFRNAQEYK
jgi:calcineurin-like phosphoesterase family protein